MIDKRYGKFVPVCDGCEKELPAEDTFHEAAIAAQEAGWQYVPEYENYCTDCQEAME